MERKAAGYSLSLCFCWALYLLIYHQLISSTAETLVPKQLATCAQSKYPVHTV